MSLVGQRSGDWIVQESDGNIYYFNETSGESTWHPPAGVTFGDAAPQTAPATGPPVAAQQAQQQYAQPAAQPAPAAVQPAAAAAQPAAAAAQPAPAASPAFEPMEVQAGPDPNDHPKPASSSRAAAGGGGACFGIPIQYAIAGFVAVAAIIILPVILTLPETASCFKDDKAYFVEYYENPKVTEVYPPMVCTWYEEKPIVLEAGNTLYYNSLRPTLSLIFNTSLLPGELSFPLTSYFEPPVPVDDIASCETQACIDKGVQPIPFVELYDASPPADPSYEDNAFGDLFDAGCRKFGVRKQTVNLCEALGSAVPQDNNNTLTELQYPVVRFLNPKPPKPHPVATISDKPCDAYSIGLLTLVPPPDIFDVYPPVQCVGHSDSLTIRGEFFIDFRDANLTLNEFFEPDLRVNGGSVDGNLTEMVDATCNDFAVNVTGYADVRHCTQSTLSFSSDDYTGTPDGGVSTHEIDITNPAPADCYSKQTHQVLTVAPPTITQVVPPAVCTDEADQEVELVGTSFLIIDGMYPTFTMTDETLTNCNTFPLNGEFCTQLNVVNGSESGCQTYLVGGAQSPGQRQSRESPVEHTIVSCTSIRVTIPQKASGRTEAFAPDIQVSSFNADVDVKLNNRQCDRTFSGLLMLTPGPVLTAVLPPALCDYADQPITVTGDNFYTYDGDKPVVELLVDDVVELTVPSADVAPLGCTQLLSSNGNVPVNGAAVQVCTGLGLAVDSNTLMGQNYTLRVTNPAPLDCSSDFVNDIVRIPAASVASATPAQTCSDGVSAVTLTGVFYTVGGAESLVVLNPDTDAALGTNVTLSSCTPEQVGSQIAQRCTALSFNMPPPGSLPTGDVLVRVLAPCQTDAAPGTLSVLSTAEITSAADQSFAGQGLPPPALSYGVAPTFDTQPDHICEANTHVVRFSGSNIAIVDGTDPALALNGTAFTAELDAARPGSNNCTVLDASVTLCTSVDTTITPFSLPTGEVDLFIENNPNDGCESTIQDILSVVPVPVLDSVVPAEYCVDQGATVYLYGSDFDVGSAYVDFYTDQRNQGSGGLRAGPTTLDNTLNSTAIMTTWNANEPPSGYYNVTVTNIFGCSDTIPRGMFIHPRLLVFYVDPGVVYNEIALQITIFVSGLPRKVFQVDIIQSGNATNSITFMRDDTTTPKPEQWNRIQVTIPLEFDIVGSYGIRVTSDIGCTDFVDNVLNITDSVTMALDSVNPAFIYNNETTGISVAAAETLGMGQVDFGNTGAPPRLYINPDVVTENTTAFVLPAAVRQSAKEMTAIIPKGLDPGVYDLVVVDNDGNVGLLDKAFTILPYQVPRVDSIVPNSLDTTGTQVVTITGEGFDESSPTAHTLQLDCTTTQGDAETYTEGNADPALEIVIDQAWTNPSPGTLVVGFTPGTVAAGTFCVVRVTKNVDDAFALYTGVSFSNPAAKLNAFFNFDNLDALGTPAAEALKATVPDMVTPRRGMQLTPGRVTSSSRYLYAIGGDQNLDATIGSQLTSVESTKTDQQGGMGAFFTQRYPLPEPASFGHAVTIGRYVYVTAYHNGTAANGETLRALILSPLETPAVDLDLDVLPERADEFNFTQGVYYYSVSAIFAEDNDSNPGGESLPGEVLTVQLPDVRGIRITLNWPTVPLASGYRLYRSPQVNADIQELTLLAELSGNSNTSFVDTGARGLETTQPLPEGSLGQWNKVAGVMNTPRWASAVTSVRSSLDENEYYVFAVAGQDTGNTLLADYEFFTVNVNAPASELASETHVVSGWTTGVGAAHARAFHSARTMTRETMGAYDANDFGVLVGMGLGQETTLASTYVDEGTAPKTVPAGNGKGSFVRELTNANSITNENNINGHGRCMLQAGGKVYLIAGQKGTFGAFAANDLVGANGAVLGVNPPPSDFAAIMQDGDAAFGIGNWPNVNPGAGENYLSRAYAACVVENAQVYILGGVELDAMNDAFVSGRTERSPT